MSSSNRFALRTGLTLMGFLSFSVLAEEPQAQTQAQAQVKDSQSITPSFLFETSGGDGAEHIELAVGLEPKDQNNSFAGLYLAKSSLGDDGTVKEIGIKAFNFNDAMQKSYGAEMHLAYSKTKLSDYKRRGFEVGVNLYGFFTESLAMYAGVSLRPRLLSLDWSNKALFEVSSNIGLSYQLPYNLSLFTQYQYDNFIKDNWASVKIGDHVMIGGSWLY